VERTAPPLPVHLQSKLLEDKVTQFDETLAAAVPWVGQIDSKLGYSP
jgi:hypothetical protein